MASPCSTTTSCTTPRRTKPGGRYCVAGGPDGVGCKNGQFTEGISLHQFPKVKNDGTEADKEREKARRLWIKFVGKHRPGYKPSATSSLCSAHFEPSCFTKDPNIAASCGIRRRDLSRGAVPTIDTAGLPTPSAPVTERARRRVVHEALVSGNTGSAELQGDSQQDGESDQEIRDGGEIDPPLRNCEDCKAHKKKIISLQKIISRLKRREQAKQTDTVDCEVEDPDDSDHPSACEDEDEEEEEEEVVSESDDDDENEEDTDYEPEESSAAESLSSDEDEDDDGGSSGNRVNVDPGTHCFDEPKYMVFFSMLVSLFSLFCFKCKKGTPRVAVMKNGTMATVTQSCKSCGKDSFKWQSQPFVFGKYPAGNILISFGILMSGVSISKTFLMFKHIGMSMFSTRTYFNHQSKFFFPSILHHWNTYRQGLVNLLKGKEAVQWSGDGRYDSMGHSAKYGAYTMFCNTISKIVHFELLQANQSGSSNAMELDGAKGCFSFLTTAGLTISTFISDRHRGIAKWIREERKDTAHFFDLWHVCKSLIKELHKASKEKGCEVIGEWLRSIKKHLYWCALSTAHGFGDLIVAKWTSIVRHVANKHDNHPNPTFPTCAHEPQAEERKWIFSGSLPHDKLKAICLKTSRLKDIRRLPAEAQTSCLEGFHSTLNHWHQKMTHFSYTGSYCRHILATLHFNENLKRQRKTTAEGRVYYQVTYPKYKLGEEVVKKVPTAATYRYVCDIRGVMLNTPMDQLQETYKEFSKKVPAPLCSQFPERRPRGEAIQRFEERIRAQTQLYPAEQEQSTMRNQLEAEARASTSSASVRKQRCCKKCKQPMRGHPKTHCPSTTT